MRTWNSNSTSLKNLFNSLIENGVVTEDDIVDALINYGVPNVIINVVKCMDTLNKRNINRLTNFIIKNGKYFHCYQFALNVKSAPIDSLADAVILKFKSRKNKVYVEGKCYYTGIDTIIDFAFNVPGAPFDKLKDTIYSTGDRLCIDKFEHRLKELNPKPIDPVYIEWEKSRIRDRVQGMDDKIKILHLLNNSGNTLNYCADIYIELFDNCKPKTERNGKVRRRILIKEGDN